MDADPAGNTIIIRLVTIVVFHFDERLLCRSRDGGRVGQ